MTDIKSQNQPFYRATLLLRSLFRSGVRHLIISPGSRSTPLALAAAALPSLQKQVILDERSAAFAALGIGKATNQPAALICTSGTAVANYFPAVIEARKSAVPLLMLTADRPPELHGTGANQTIDQQHIFGDYPVLFRDAGEPVMNEKETKNLEELALQAVAGSIKKQGPVHLNFPFSKPLEPGQEFVEIITRENKELDDSLAAAVPKSRLEEFRFDDKLLQHIQSAEKPLVIIGQLAPGTEIAPICQLAEALHAPMLSEQDVSSSNSIKGFEGFLRDPVRAQTLAPDLILRFGHQPACKSLLEAIKWWAPRRHIHFSDTEYRSDIAGATTDHVSWRGNPFVTDHFSEKSSRRLQRWKKKEDDYFEQSGRLLETQQTLTDGHIYHHLAPAIPNNWFTFFSNSFPVRDRSMFGRWSRQKVYTNRGASGIDGITSTAIGVNIGARRSGILFTGDLAFLHDTNALLNKKALQQPLVVVIINNHGGSIFRMLPIAEHETHFNTYFETPQQADISSLAMSYGIHTQTITTISELRQLDLKKVISRSESMLHIIECQTDPDASMQVRHKLWGE